MGSDLAENGCALSGRLKSSTPSLSVRSCSWIRVWVKGSVKEIRQNTTSHFCRHSCKGPASGGLKVILLRLFYWWFPSNMKHFFSHLTTNTCAASGLSFTTYTDNLKRRFGVSSARPASHVRSCTELHADTFTHLSWIFMVRCTLHLTLL